MSSQSLSVLLAPHDYPLPQAFADAIAQVKTFALQVLDHEIAEKSLYYHTHAHVEGVQRRAKQLFQVMCPDFLTWDSRSRLEQLLDLCAVAHDMIQIFAPRMEPFTSRRREAGVSEAATIDTLLVYIQHLNQALRQDPAATSAQFTEFDLQIIREAIAATVCGYNAAEQAVFQPALYELEQPISIIARILAFADIGALGMEGIAAYNTEGSLLFLEENPDVRLLIEKNKIAYLATHNPSLHENIRQRLLRRARFQVSFARSRLHRFPQELQGLPDATITKLINEVFQHLTPETIQTRGNYANRRRYFTG